MDFKTELQNLVNRYPGIIKKVKVEFTKEIEVSPNGEAPPAHATLLSHGLAVNPISEIIQPTGLTPEGLSMLKPKQVPFDIAQAQASALSAVHLAAAAAKARQEAKTNPI